MRTRLHLKPGQKGTKLLLAQYGDRLVCVRYRYDAQRKKRFKTMRFKTMELIIAEREWEPLPPRVAADMIVGVRVGFSLPDTFCRLNALSELICSFGFRLVLWHHSNAITNCWVKAVIEVVG